MRLNTMLLAIVSLSTVLLIEAGVSESLIYKYTAEGNTTMLIITNVN